MSKNLNTLLSLRRRGVSDQVCIINAIEVTHSTDPWKKKDWRWKCAELIVEYYAEIYQKDFVDELYKLRYENKRLQEEIDFYKREIAEAELKINSANLEKSG